MPTYVVKWRLMPDDAFDSPSRGISGTAAPSAPAPAQEAAIDNLSAALVSTRKQMWDESKRADEADARRLALEGEAIHPALAIDVQEHRQQAYQNGWDDGYAEGFGKASATAQPAQEAKPVAFITKTGLDNWMKGDQPEKHVLLRSGGEMRVPLYTHPAQEAVTRAMSRDEILVHPDFTKLATDAAKRIARAERLDTVGAKEAYRTIIETIAAALAALEPKHDAL